MKSPAKGDETLNAEANTTSVVVLGLASVSDSELRGAKTTTHFVQTYSGLYKFSSTNTTLGVLPHRPLLFGSHPECPSMAGASSPTVNVVVDVTPTARPPPTCRLAPGWSRQCSRNIG